MLCPFFGKFWQHDVGWNWRRASPGGNNNTSSQSNSPMKRVYNYDILIQRNDGFPLKMFLMTLVGQSRWILALGIPAIVLCAIKMWASQRHHESHIPVDQAMRCWSQHYFIFPFICLVYMLYTLVYLWIYLYYYIHVQPCQRRINAPRLLVQ
jgi:hypothetical protein